MVFDIQRVEINRGPQGTLRGRNATAGTLDVITNAPEFGKLGASATLQYGNYSQALTQGMLNIPIGDKLALRLATFSEQHEPFFKNAGPIDTLRAAEDANTLAYRASLRWAPTDWSRGDDRPRLDGGEGHRLLGRQLLRAAPSGSPTRRDRGPARRLVPRSAGADGAPPLGRQRQHHREPRSREPAAPR